MENVSSSNMGISRSLVGWMLDLLEHGMLKLAVFRNTPAETIDRFMKLVGPELRDAWIELLEKRFQDFTGIFRVPVNYEPGAIAKAIEEAGFDNKYLGIPLEDIPLVGSGQAVREVHEVPFDRVMYNRDLAQALKERGESLGFKGVFKFVDPLTALRFACANRDRQRKYPLAILFTDSNGQLCFLYLTENAGWRDLRVGRDSPGGDWGAAVRFLAVCELPSGA